MNDQESDSAAEDKAAIRGRMDALATELTANGLPATVHVAYGVFDISVTLHQPGQKDINIVIDEDGYTELRSALTLPPALSRPSPSSVTPWQL
jgi:hypothetical protein